MGYNQYTNNIEFFGMPGSGKTTIAKELLSKYKENNQSVNGMNIELERKKRSERIYLKIKFILKYLILEPYVSVHLFKIIFKTKQKNIKEFIKVFLNFIFIMSVYRSNKCKNNILDQGIVQSIWATIYSSNISNHITLFSELLNICVKNINQKLTVILVETNIDIVIRRFSERNEGSKRLYLKLNRNYESFKNAMLFTTEITKKVLNASKNKNLKIITIENNDLFCSDRIELLYKDIYE